MKMANKRKLVFFLKKYRSAKENANASLPNGNINKYLKQLIKAVKAENNALTIMNKG